jgi:hypothetical protein
MLHVTVLMAVHNGEPYLKEAVESILGQSFGDFEFVIIEDGSTDGSRDVLAAYADSRVRLLVNERQVGLARSLNRGLRVAAGRYVARQDADDISEPERLAKQVAFFEPRPDVALAGTCYREIDAGGAIIAMRELPLEDTGIRWALLFYCPFVHTAAMFRRAQVLDEVGLYDESFAYAMDYELWLRIARRFRMANLAEALVRLRLHPDSMTETYGERTQEGSHLRCAALGRLLGTDPEPAVAGAMYDLVVKAAFHGHARDLVHAARNLLQLQPAFCSSAALSEAESRSHLTRLRRQLALQLVLAARSHRGARRYADVVHLLAAATATFLPFRTRARQEFTLPPR